MGMDKVRPGGRAHVRWPCRRPSTWRMGDAVIACARGFLAAAAPWRSLWDGQTASIVAATRRDGNAPVSTYPS
jgi:hypothetical protein